MPLDVKVASPDGKTVRTVTERIWGAEICLDCWEIWGSLTVDGAEGRSGYEQHCSCWRHLPAAERWPGYDFNRYIELCYCCGIEPIRSGSRWSRFHCEECMDRVLSFNRRFGHWVIPIGRHSLMHGAGLGTGESAEPFAAELRGLFDAIHHLDDWAGITVRRNVLRLMSELRTWDDLSLMIDLASYLDGVRTLGLDKQVAFEGLSKQFTAS